MIKPDQIPDAVVEAAAQKTAWGSHKAAREAIAAALNAWPNMARAKWSDRTFILPLPQESDND